MSLSPLISSDTTAGNRDSSTTVSAAFQRAGHPAAVAQGLRIKADETAKDLLTFRRPAGAGQDNFPPMTVKDAKGTLKLWVHDGVMTKMQTHLTGTRSFNDQDQPVDQTTTTQIKDVGKTKISVPDEAKNKLETAIPG